MAILVFRKVTIFPENSDYKDVHTKLEIALIKTKD